MLEIGKTMSWKAQVNLLNKVEYMKDSSQITRNTEKVSKLGAVVKSLRELGRMEN